MTTQDPSFPERPDPDRPGDRHDDRPGDRPGGEGHFGSGSHGGGPVPPPPPAPPPPPSDYGGETGRYGAEPRNGLGTAALVCGIVAIALSLIPVINVFTWPLGVLAIVFGGIGWARVNKGQATNKGQAITGLVLGIVSFFTFCLIYMLIGAGSDQYYSMVPF